MPLGFTNMSYEVWRLPRESRLNPTQSSLKSVSRRRTPVRMRFGSGSVHLKAK